MIKDKNKDVVIIGAGPAGIAAAIQLKRQGIAPVVYEKQRIGGMLNNANLVENYPGFPDGISGPDLANLFKKHLAGLSIEILFEEVFNLDFLDEAFVLNTSNGQKHSETVIIASGTKPREISDIAMPDHIRDRILYEVYPVLNEKGKKIVVVGAGDAAFDYALNLAKNNDVMILNRGKRIKCLPLLKQRAEKTSRINYYSETSITKISGDSGGLLELVCNSIKETLLLKADYVIFAIGRAPQLDFMSKELELRVKELEKRGALYIIGDANSGLYRQSAIAVGQGIMAAMKISWFLKGE